jgi:hypothetical protein
MKRTIWIAVSSGCAAAILFLFWQARTYPHLNLLPSPAAQENALRPSPNNLATNSPTPGSQAAIQASTDSLRPTVVAAIGRTEQRDFRTRLRAIGQLGVSLDFGERQVLYEHVRDRSDDKWLRPGQGFALKNEILNVLCEQQETPPELVDFLVTLWRDASQPIPIRDYAVQHFAPLFSKTNEAQQRRITEELMSAAAEVDESYAGTALITLNRIEQENWSSSLGGWRIQVPQLLDNPVANLSARIAAVQLSGELNLQETTGAVRGIVLDDTQATTLRVAAIAALGRLAGEEHAQVLERIKADTDKRLRFAAESALQRLGTSNQ